MPIDYLPLFVKGIVTRGYRRGTELLGIPTANFDDDSISKLPEYIQTGVYACVATVQDYEGIFAASTSIGNNPHFNGTKLTMESYILNDFYPYEFYGKEIKLALIHYIRPMSKFSTVDDLIKAIKADIECTRKIINKPELENMKLNGFFHN